MRTGGAQAPRCFGKGIFMAKEQRQNFISGAAVLAAAVAVTKVLGAVYKIPLGNLLDKEGMAHFYVAYNIYSLLLILSTAGLPLALSRLVSRAHALGRENQKRRVFSVALAIFLAIGLVCKLRQSPVSGCPSDAAAETRAYRADTSQR